MDIGIFWFCSFKTLLIAKNLVFAYFWQDGNSGDDFNKESIERDERRLTELGRRTLEIFVLAHVFRYYIQLVLVGKGLVLLVVAAVYLLIILLLE